MSSWRYRLLVRRLRKRSAETSSPAIAASNSKLSQSERRPPSIGHQVPPIAGRPERNGDELLLPLSTVLPEHGSESVFDTCSSSVGRTVRTVPGRRQGGINPSSVGSIFDLGVLKRLPEFEEASFGLDAQCDLAAQLCSAGTASSGNRGNTVRSPSMMPVRILGLGFSRPSS
jgi:hypothetical protein